MIARGAQTNPSVFRMEGFLSYDVVVKAYLKKVRVIFHDSLSIIMTSIPLMCLHQTKSVRRYRQLGSEFKVHSVGDVHGI